MFRPDIIKTYEDLQLMIWSVVCKILTYSQILSNDHQKEMENQVVWNYPPNSDEYIKLIKNNFYNLKTRFEFDAQLKNCLKMTSSLLPHDFLGDFGFGHFVSKNLAVHRLALHPLGLKKAQLGEQPRSSQLNWTKTWAENGRTVYQLKILRKKNELRCQMDKIW